MNVHYFLALMRFFLILIMLYAFKLSALDLSSSIRVESGVDTHEVVTGQQILYTLTIFHITPLDSPSLPPLSIKDALVFQAGAVQTGQINGESYIQIKWAVFPLKPGNITPPPLTFTTGITKPDKNTAQVNISNGHKTNIQMNIALPSVIVSPLSRETFPAKALRLSESLTEKSKGVDAKKYIQKTITMEAEGLPARLIPTPLFKNTSKERIEIIEIIRKNIGSHKGITGVKTVLFNIIPVQTGVINLPDITIDWWNTTRQTFQKSVLKGKRWIVRPHETEADQKPAPKANTVDRHYTILVASLVATSLVLLFFCFVKRKKCVFNVKRNQEKACWRQLVSSCKSRDIKQTRIAFETWIAQYGTHIQNISKKRIKAHIYQVDKDIYSKEKSKINTDEILEKLHILRQWLTTLQKKSQKQSIMHQAFLDEDALSLLQGNNFFNL